MPYKDPATYPLLTYAWVLTLSAWGGIVSFNSKMKQGISRPFNIAELMGEICTSAFAGVLTFYLCEAAEIAPILSAAFVGVSGHMGSRAIFKIEKWAESKIK